MKSRTKAVSIGHIEVDASKFDAKVDLNSLPVLPTRNMVMFPQSVAPINLIRPASRALAERAEREKLAVAVVCQKNADVEEPCFRDLCDYGVVAQVIKVIKLPDDSMMAVVRAERRIRIVEQAEGPGLRVKARSSADPKMTPDKEDMMKLKMAHEMAHQLSSENGLPVEMVDSSNREEEMVNFSLQLNNLCAQSPIPVSQKSELLRMRGLRNRLDGLTGALMLGLQHQKLAEELEEKTRRRMGERARQAFLEAKMEEIREELQGDEAGESAPFREDLEAMKFPPEVKETLEREVRKLERLNPSSPDFQTQYSYLDTVFSLPWNRQTDDNTDFNEARSELEQSHYGLDKVKERVLEHLAVMINAPGIHAPILCLVGPPGVGKTSLGKSIAAALGRKFHRVSLGGLHDESEIRGHRRTYIGAMPGRILDAVRRAESLNPVIMLDEIDKVGADYKGDPSAALLEVLDPEQNVKFHDNYIDIDFDLSKVMFIVTANSLAPISAPLRDRMEVIELSGYSTPEKVEIAERHLLPQLLEEMGLKDSGITLKRDALELIINEYTSESGVRQLQKQLAKTLRRYLMEELMEKKKPAKALTAKKVAQYLGVPPISRDKYGTDGLPGVVTGLAWTSAGGEVLYIETLLTDGKQNSALTLTGNLGDVMKESASLAHRYVLAHAEYFGISKETMQKDVHLHVPEGAIPKDGPSAGITMTTAIVSAMTGRPVRPHVAMTGEMTLRGRVLPVGGIKEKMLAAKRAGVREIIISEENRRNVEEIPAEYLSGLEFHFVTSINEVIDLALEP